MDRTGTPAPPHAMRRTDDRILGGVASGLAAHLGVEPMMVRAVFLLTAALGGFGLALYAGLWMLLPAEEHLEASAPGLEFASRRGLRSRRLAGLPDVGWLIALAAVGLGSAVLLRGVLGSSFPFWPVLIGALGLALLWRQADEAQRERWLDSTGRVNWSRAVLGNGGWASYARIVAGIGLLSLALVVFAAQNGRFVVARDVVVAGLLGVLGLALVIGPWLFRLVGDLSEERAARVRTEERADVAAHLHDSVLQTLALIQKSSGDSATVARLARAQERDLRSWLYDGERASSETVAGALRAAAAEVDDVHGVPVEVVAVGDAPLSDELRPLVLAAREAMVNAAKHSGADRVDVYAELVDGSAEVYVRDRGRGFDEAGVPVDRLGIRNSIVDRMRRHGGSADLRTAPGQGTEVRLHLGAGSTGTEEGR